MKRRASATAVKKTTPAEMAEAMAEPPSERAARDAKFKHLGAVAKEFGSFRPASEVLVRVSAVPTIFPQFDLATKVGGLPIERVTLLHGSSAGGKTYFAIGLMYSFLLRDHPVFFVDAERTTPIPWLRKAMGAHADHPLFKAVKPKTYEDTRTDVRAFLNTVKRMRDAGKLRDDTTALVVVDSIRKLVPRDQFKMIMQLAKVADKDEGARSRIAQIKAQMNAAWLDELVVLLDETRTALVIIAREMMDPNNTNPRAIRFGTNVKTAGGAALFYDASLDIRCSRVRAYGKKMQRADGGDGLAPYGDVHRIDITKSKVSGRGEEYRSSCEFHISNGAHVPAGFDRARDLVAVARRFDVIEGTGWLSFKKNRWRSEDVAVKALAADAALFDEVERATRPLFKGEDARQVT